MGAAAKELGRRHRRTFALTPTDNYYRFFRISSAGTEVGVSDGLGCLHGIGLELYGDVHEE